MSLISLETVCVCSAGVFGADEDEVKAVSVMEGRFCHSKH